MTWNKRVKNQSWSYQGEPETERLVNFRGGEPPISDSEDLARLPVKVALGVFATKDANTFCGQKRKEKITFLKVPVPYKALPLAKIWL